MNWQLFFSVYVVIFLAELPDKTAFATLMMATKSRALAIFTGVALAFLVQTTVSVVFGSVLSLLPQKWVHLGAGLLFLAFAIQMWKQRNEIENQTTASNGSVAGFWPSTWKAFLVIFIAEWGDLTQIATASLIAKYSESKITVFCAAVSALWTVTGIAVFVGHRAKRLVKLALLKRMGAFLFLAIGVYFIATFTTD